MYFGYIIGDGRVDMPMPSAMSVIFERTAPAEMEPFLKTLSRKLKREHKPGLVSYVRDCIHLLHVEHSHGPTSLVPLSDRSGKPLGKCAAFVSYYYPAFEGLSPKR